MTADYFAGDPRTNHERMLAGNLYVADHPEIERRHRRGIRLTDAPNRAEVAEDPAARRVLVERLGSMGDGVHVNPPLFVDYGENIHIGASILVNHNLTALDMAAITIGADCQIGPNVQLLTPTHPIDPRPRRDKLEATEPIPIEDKSGSVAASSCARA